MRKRSDERALKVLTDHAVSHVEWYGGGELAVCVCGGMFNDPHSAYADEGRITHPEHQLAVLKETHGVIEWPSIARGEYQQTGVCPDAPHRGPQGPNEDIGQCVICWSPSFGMRPEGETFGNHLPDCSLHIDHESSYCVGGGEGHPPSKVVRG